MSRPKLALLLVAVLGCLALAEPASSQDTAVANSPVLSISGGGQFQGAPKKPTESSRVAWQTQSFATPFEFPLENVAAIKFERKAAAPIREGDLSWEFVGGDILIGKLSAVTDTELTIDTPSLGEVKVKRAALSAIYRSKVGSTGAFEGPGELASWKVPPKSDGWQTEDNGAISSKTKYARLWRTIDMPEMSKIELELTWRQKAALSFEVTEEADKLKLRNRQQVIELNHPASYRIEVAGSQLIAAREAASSADVSPIQDVALGEGRLHLLLYIDQTKGSMTVCRPSGELIAKVESAGAPKEHLKLLRFSSGEGDLRIETLRVSPWSGVQPITGKGDTATFSLEGTGELVAKIEGFDGDKREWLLRVGEEDRRVKETQINEIRFVPSEAATQSKAKLVFRSGMLLNGELIQFEAGTVKLNSALLGRELSASYQDLQALYQRTPPLKTEPENNTESQQRAGRLEAAGLVTMGLLVNHKSSEGADVVGWRPQFALNDAAIDSNFSGRIVYKELPPPPPVVPEQVIARAPAVRVRSSTGAATIGQLKNTGSAKPMIYLRTGDMVQGEVVKIDESGVEFRSSETKSTFIKHKELRAVELVPNVASIGIPKAKKDRLLMLPRSQRESPPTHLVRSLKGDYLRCRIVGMDENNLDVEVRLESKRIARNTIARIIWLHPEDAAVPNTEGEQAAAAPPKKSELKFQAIPETRKRLTFVPERVANYLLIGQSPILGECSIDLQTTSVLLIGATIENSSIPLAYEQWKLRPAPEPLAASETPSEDGGADGLESVLVGKPAPEIELAMLDGTKFSLAKHKNKVLVLDFWASWCGPCIQAMPQIHQVAGEFKTDGVELVGINLEEEPDRIKATLKRLELDLAVALDRDGRIAGKYGATSIPQTVIIDAEGKVARVFVGGGPRLGEQIRQALQVALGKTPAPDVKPKETTPADSAQ